MSLRPQLSLGFNGQCESALRHYERCLNGTLTFILRWGQSPSAAEAPEGWADKIFHATLHVSGTVMMGGDVPPDRYQQPKGFDLVLQVDDPDEAERAFHALAEGGTIRMPLQETFWAKRFGALVDRFGIPWSVNCEKRPSDAST